MNYNIHVENGNIIVSTGGYYSLERLLMNFADTLFAGGIGRCDLYSSDSLCMEASLKKLGTLPPDLTIYPGHGSTMRLGEALNHIGL